MLLDEGGHSYDPALVVHNTSHLAVFILAACMVSFIGAYMQYVGAIRMGFRHRTYSIPLVANLWNFVHDTTYVMQFDRWFHGSDGYWIAKAFWFALAVFALGEVVVVTQMMRFSRHELFPGRSLPEALASYAVLLLFVYGIFWWFQSMISDPYYYLSFSTTVIIASLFNIQMMRTRGSRRGFSQTMLTGYLLLSVGFWSWMALSDGYFRRPFFWLIALGNIAIDLASIRVFRGLPDYHAPVVAGRQLEDAR